MEKIKSTQTNLENPRHLLVGLLYLKVYGTETVHASLLDLYEKTVRKLQWKALDALASIKMVSVLKFVIIFF